MQRLWWATVCVGLLFLSTSLGSSAFAQNAVSDAIPGSQVQFALGAFNVVADNETAVEGRIEWRGALTFPALSPLAGLMATSDGAAYAFAGLYIDFEFFERLVVTPSAAAGLYSKGSGRDLGDAVQFRSQIEVAYTLSNATRLGLSLSHLSDGGFSSTNSGSESVVLSYALPLSSLQPK
jgi:outer membrane receptor protein involved in Fe transport